MTDLPDIVITGPPVVGKGIISKILLRNGAKSIIDTSESVRKELRDLGELAPEHTRQTAFASQEIRLYGGGVFVDRLLDDRPGPHVIDDPRRLIEIQHLLSRGAVLAFIDAPIASRYVWSCARRSERDGLSFEEFEAKDKLEWGYVPDGMGGWLRHDNPYERNLRYAFNHAHAVLHNDGGLSRLQETAEEFVAHLLTGEVGPSSKWMGRTYGLATQMKSRA